jgi:hypothetical protein
VNSAALFPISLVNFQGRQAESRTVLGGVLEHSVLKHAKQWTGETSQLEMKMEAAGFSETTVHYVIFLKQIPLSPISARLVLTVIFACCSSLNLA